MREQSTKPRRHGGVRILVAAAATRELGGVEPTDAAALKAAGAVALTDDGLPVLAEDVIIRGRATPLGHRRDPVEHRHVQQVERVARLAEQPQRRRRQQPRARTAARRERADDEGEHRREEPVVRKSDRYGAGVDEHDDADEGRAGDGAGASRRHLAVAKRAGQRDADDELRQPQQRVVTPRVDDDVVHRGANVEARRERRPQHHPGDEPDDPRAQRAAQQP